MPSNFLLIKTETPVFNFFRTTIEQKLLEGIVTQNLSTKVSTFLIIKDLTIMVLLVVLFRAKCSAKSKGSKHAGSVNDRTRCTRDVRWPLKKMNTISKVSC